MTDGPNKTVHFVTIGPKSPISDQRHTRVIRTYLKMADP